MARLLLFLLFCGALRADYPGQIARILDAGAGTVILSNNGTGGDPAPLIFRPSGSQKVKLVLSPIPVGPTWGETFSPCADPCTISADFGTARWNRWAEYVDTDGNSFSPRKLVSRLAITQQEPATITTSPLPMPLEILGQEWTAFHFQVSVAAAAATSRLRMEINNPCQADAERTDAKLSVQINGLNPITGVVGWADLTPANVTSANEWGYYGPFCHNFFDTVIVDMAVANGVLVTGNNSFGWRKNATDGITSGGRILNFNILQPSVTITSRSTTSNVTTITTSGAHGFSNGQYVWQEGVRGGPYCRHSGLRLITGVPDTTHYTYTPGETSPLVTGCTTPDEPAATVPNSRNTDVWPAPVATTARALIAGTAFTWTNGNAFTLPAGMDASDAAAGLTLWSSQQLVVADPYLGNTTIAKCATCHPLDGVDLQYFKYSNESIKVRSEFHGLTGTQGLQIAAYIRSLTYKVPPMGYPFNPTIQPGPGVDADDGWNWEAGRGLHSVLNYGNDWMECAAPGGSTANWMFDQNFKMRECPLNVQLATWRQQLPRRWMQDAFPAVVFTDSDLFTGYTTFRDALVACQLSGTINSGATSLTTTASCACTNGDKVKIDDEAIAVGAGCGTTALSSLTRGTDGTTAASHADSGIGNFTKYKAAGGNYGGGFPGPHAGQGGSINYAYATSPIPGQQRPVFSPSYVPPSTYISNAYDIDLWMISKNFEIFKQYYLENMTDLVLTDQRGACTTCPGGAYHGRGIPNTKEFEMSYHRNMAAGAFNTIDTYAEGLSGTQHYGFQSNGNSWYWQQRLHYAGWGTQTGNVPDDPGYTLAFVGNQSRVGRPMGPAGIGTAMYTVQQSAQDYQTAPPVAQIYFAGPISGSLENPQQPRYTQGFMSDAEIEAEWEFRATNYLAILNSISTSAWATHIANGAYAGFLPCPSTTPAPLAYGGSANVCAGAAYYLAAFEFYNVTSSKIDDIQTILETIFPTVTWATQRSASCSLDGGTTPPRLDCTNFH